MNFKSLLANAELRALSAADFKLGSLPIQGQELLGKLLEYHSGKRAARMTRDRFDHSLEITSYPYATASWYADRDVVALYWPGDLVIHGDLLDDDFNLLPVLVVRGDLILRSWLRGGMAGFIGGSVRASGFIVGHYNDAALFVGGDLSAAGYLPCAKPYADLRDVAPHQIAGRIDARRMDLLASTDASLRAALVDEVLCEDDEAVYLDEKAVLSRSSAGLPVWRDGPAEGS